MKTKRFLSQPADPLSLLFKGLVTGTILGFIAGIIVSVILVAGPITSKINQMQWTADVQACMKFMGVELSYCQIAADILARDDN